ncbi:toprim domain-containing protein [Aeoliella sp.]|uniref:toprim domain-containing protein n=1 Tax=Aeoliella sp. TaxID=2795800 RepID=UPI003CCBCA53
MNRATRNDELEALKTQINLSEYMASRGFALDPKTSSRHYSVMRHPNGDKCIVTRKANRHWIYANAHDSRDSGTIVDFVQLRDRVSIGEVRKELRPWLGQSGLSAASPLPQFPELVPSQHDAAKVGAAWENANPIHSHHEYLESERQITNVLADPIFSDRIRTDQRRNALFAHFNTDGLCGFEIKNRGFTGFSTGGVKGLFCSRPGLDDSELVICETAIDALSFATLFGTNGKRFVSTAGQISPLQRSLLQSAAQKMPRGSTIILAMDNDPGGHKLAEAIADALSEVNGKQVTQHLPPREGEDWNDVLCRSPTSQMRTAAPTL